jgi:hypothetical protein
LQISVAGIVEFREIEVLLELTHFVVARADDQVTKEFVVVQSGFVFRLRQPPKDLVGFVSQFQKHFLAKRLHIPASGKLLVPLVSEIQLSKLEETLQQQMQEPDSFVFEEVVASHFCTILAGSRNHVRYRHPRSAGPFNSRADTQGQTRRGRHAGLPLLLEDMP